MIRTSTRVWRWRRSFSERSSESGSRGRCKIRSCRPQKRFLSTTLAIYFTDHGADIVSKDVASRIPHYRVPQEPKMNEVHFDFAFLGKEDEPGKLAPMLVIRERITGMTMASTMPTKSAGTFITSRILAFLRRLVVNSETCWRSQIKNLQ